MEFLERPLYVDKLLDSVRTNQIKLITGVRHAGKSAILSLFQRKLISNGIDQNDIIYIDFESADYAFITESVTFYEFLTSRISQTKLTYLILDEIQGIKDWQKVIKALKLDFNVDIYISLSRVVNVKELGRDITKIEVFPLSLKEYCKFKGISPIEPQVKDKIFDSYIETTLPNKSLEKLNDIFYSIIAQDVLLVNKIADNAMMMLLIRILMSEMGKTHSFNSLCKLLNEVVEKAPAVRTVESYIKMLLEARIFYCVPVFDIKDNHSLSRYAKYYPVDLGFYNLIMGKPNKTDIHILESVIYFELLRLGVKVSTCKIGQKKVAFLAESEDNKIYIHVTDSMSSDLKVKSIMAPLRAISDHYSKWVITLENQYTHSTDGIRIGNIIDFLLADEINS